MIAGYVTSEREAIVNIHVRGSSSKWTEIGAVIDTGFTGLLALPDRAITSLQLHYVGSTRVALASGRPQSMDLYAGTVQWASRQREILIHATEDASLVGMGLLGGFRLSLDIIDGGRVDIRPIRC